MNQLIHRTVTTALLVAVLVVWVQLITASGDGLYIEPTSDALAVAAAVVPRGIVLSVLLIVTAAGLAWWTHWRPFLVLGLPGLVTGTLFVSSRHRNQPAPRSCTACSSASSRWWCSPP